MFVEGRASPPVHGGLSPPVFGQLHGNAIVVFGEPGFGKLQFNFTEDFYRRED